MNEFNEHNEQNDQQGNNQQSGTIRLNRFLAQCGLGSRRAAEKLIVSGHILINGKKETNLATMVEPGKDVVEYRGAAIRPMLQTEYVALNKPRGVVVTASDPQGRETVYDVLARTRRDSVDHLRYVGRLDRNSEGLLLFTNDGALTHALTHPRFGIKKVYHVRTSRPLSDAVIARMTKSGIESEGQLLKAGSIVALESDREEGGWWYEIELFEGKNRQIRRMMEAVECTTFRIKRTQFGTVRLGTLAPGESRPLTEREVGGLMNLGHKPTN
jgi:23S rRNA pseudouridine2605 synthase